MNQVSSSLSFLFVCLVSVPILDSLHLLLYDLPVDDVMPTEPPSRQVHRLGVNRRPSTASTLYTLLDLRISIFPKLTSALLSRVQDA